MGTTSMWFDIDFGLWNWLPAWEPVHIPFQPMIFRLPDLGPAPHVFSFVGRCKSQCLATESQWSTELTWTWTTIANGSTSQGGKGFDLFGKRCSKRKWCWLFGCVCRLDILINLYIIHIIHTTYIYTQYHLLCVYTHIYIHIYIYICIWNMHFGKVFHWSLSKFVIVSLQEGTESPQTLCIFSEKMSMKFIYFYQVPCIFGAQTSTSGCVACHVITEFFQSPGASRQWANASLHPRVWMLNQHIQWKS